MRSSLGWSSRPRQARIADCNHIFNRSEAKKNDKYSNKEVLKEYNKFIDMGVEGMVVEPAGVVKEGFGHHHILIDQKFWPQGEVIPMSDTTLHFGKGETDASIELEPGQYLISLQFADGVHASFGESMSSSILINVE